MALALRRTPPMRPFRGRLHPVLLTLSFLGLAAACGGKVAGGDTAGDGGKGNGGDSGGACVTVLPSAFSQSCNTAADCTVVQTGTLCQNSCDCGNTVISTASLTQYNAAVQSIDFSGCPCPSPAQPECVNGTCTLCEPGEDCDVTSEVDASADANVCVDLEPSMFDTSCTTTADCLEVTLGEICSSGCLCGGSAINAMDEAKYEQAVAPVSQGELCACPYLGSPVCVGGTCIVCGPGTSQPGCPDAGQ
jgi:hypothetical protein